MGLAKIHKVQKARKDQGKCGNCASPIVAGDPYLWFKVGFRSRVKRLRS